MYNNPINSVYKHEIKNNGITCYIDNKECKVIIKEIKDSNNNQYDLKTIITNVPLQKGSFVQIKDKYYFIIDVEEQFNQTIYNKGIIRECFEMYSNPKDTNPTPSDGDSVKLYGIINMEDNVIDNTNGLLNIVSDRYNLICKETDVIELNHILMYKNVRYKVDSVNNTINGLKLLKLTYKSIIPPEPVYTYKLSLESVKGSIYIGNTIKIKPICKRNEIIMENQTVNYTINNNSIAKIDTDGNVIGLLEGSATITCEWQGQKATYNIEVKKEIIIKDIYTLEVNPTNITLEKGKKLNLNVVYVAKKNGITAENPNISLISNNTNIVSIVGTEAEGINVGSTTITIKYETESVDINVNIKENEGKVEYKPIVIFRKSKEDIVWESGSQINDDVYIKKNGTLETFIIKNADKTEMKGRKFEFAFNDPDFDKDSLDIVSSTDDSVTVRGKATDRMAEIKITEPTNPKFDKIILTVYATKH